MLLQRTVILQVWILAPEIFPVTLKWISISFPCIINETISKLMKSRINLSILHMPDHELIVKSNCPKVPKILNFWTWKLASVGTGKGMKYEITNPLQSRIPKVQMGKGWKERKHLLYFLYFTFKANYSNLSKLSRNSDEGIYGLQNDWNYHFLMFLHCQRLPILD